MSRIQADDLGPAWHVAITAHVRDAREGELLSLERRGRFESELP